MKKLILIGFLSVMILSCKSKSATDTGIDRKSQNAMKGQWTITSVTFPGSDNFKVTSFDLADSKCFIGSQWHLISNNNQGSFTLKSANCTAYSSNITWFVNDKKEFVMKILDESKARKLKSGYVLRVANQSDNSFQLLDRIEVLGTMKDVTYQFSRN